VEVLGEAVVGRRFPAAGFPADGFPVLAAGAPARAGRFAAEAEVAERPPDAWRFPPAGA
jgi:hypothetical protein